MTLFSVFTIHENVHVFLKEVFLKLHRQNLLSNTFLCKPKGHGKKNKEANTKVTQELSSEAI